MALHPGSHGSHNTQGLGGLLSGAGGAGQGLLGGEPGLLDLIPGFRFQNDNFSVSFDPEKEKKNRLLMRLVEQQSGTRAPSVLTETAGDMGRFLGGNRIVSAPPIPGAGGSNPFASLPGQESGGF